MQLLVSLCYHSRGNCCSKEKSSYSCRGLVAAALVLVHYRPMNSALRAHEELVNRLSVVVLDIFDSERSCCLSACTCSYRHWPERPVCAPARKLAISGSRAPHYLAISHHFQARLLLLICHCKRTSNFCLDTGVMRHRHNAAGAHRFDATTSSHGKIDH